MGESLLFTVKEFDVIRSNDGVLSFRIRIIDNKRKVRRRMISCSNPFNLTGREIEVLSILAKGKSNLEIAKELFVSVHTIKAHVASILSKLEVEDRLHAAIKAISENIVKK